MTWARFWARLWEEKNVYRIAPLVVGGRRLHLDGVVAVAELGEAEAADVLEAVDPLQVPLVVPRSPQLQHRPAKQVELRINYNYRI